MHTIRCFWHQLPRQWVLYSFTELISHQDGVCRHTKRENFSTTCRSSSNIQYILQQLERRFLSHTVHTSLESSWPAATARLIQTTAPMSPVSTSKRPRQFYFSPRPNERGRDVTADLEVSKTKISKNYAFIPKEWRGFSHFLYNWFITLWHPLGRKSGGGLYMDRSVTDGSTPVQQFLIYIWLGAHVQCKHGTFQLVDTSRPAT